METLRVKKGQIFHPGDNVVQRPGDVERNCCHGEIPAICWFFGEDKGAMGHSEDQLLALFSIPRDLRAGSGGGCSHCGKIKGTYLCENQLVKKNMPLHICEGHGCHDEEGSNH